MLAVAPRVDSVSEIARKTGVCRDTVCKYVDRGDFSEEPPRKRECSTTSRAGIPSLWLSGIGG